MEEDNTDRPSFVMDDDDEASSIVEANVRRSIHVSDSKMAGSFSIFPKLHLIDKMKKIEKGIEKEIKKDMKVIKKVVGGNGSSEFGHTRQRNSRTTGNNGKQQQHDHPTELQNDEDGRKNEDQKEEISVQGLEEEEKPPKSTAATTKTTTGSSHPASAAKGSAAASSSLDRTTTVAATPRGFAKAPSPPKKKKIGDKNLMVPAHYLLVALLFPTLEAIEKIMHNEIPFWVAVLWMAAAVVADRMWLRYQEAKEEENEEEEKVRAVASKEVSSVEEATTTTTSPAQQAKALLEEKSPTASTTPREVVFDYPDPPDPPTELPARFLDAGKGDPAEGRRRYEATLAWRKEQNIDRILREPHPLFETIKANYPHFFHLRGVGKEGGREGQPVYFEAPPRTDLGALRDEGATLDILLRHFALVTEFTWQVVDRRDDCRSIYVVDMDGIKMSDFAGEVVDFVKKVSAFTGAHYPGRLGTMYVINVPYWFKAIWNVVRTWIDEETLKKVYIVRGRDNIKKAMLEHIPIENIPTEYGGESTFPLGEAPQELELFDLMRHNNNPEKHCKGRDAGCKWCNFQIARAC